MIIQLDELEVYKVAMELGEDTWQMVDGRPVFAKDTIGKQIVRSADSIALNIAEGYGRFHFKENKNFCYIARGSNMETKCAMQKAVNRKLINEPLFVEFNLKQQRFHKLVNGYIKSIGSNKIGQ
jgi:four helix bundle protein